ncbi:hypothetical protein QBC46DRAFT_127697 [Diplogelasinospora grovesii]|uniref:Zn(2)-C6 fungal-type domain-containing protein n=1 Tax=Diplogelasinospora grovesii TaxID=303347 RepID=A0AAN6S4J5_9PEZI|nr:hypothetical protein QBC46DRAFT_127697 [Diplogelasinospora grovesii]
MAFPSAIGEVIWQGENECDAHFSVNLNFEQFPDAEYHADAGSENVSQPPRHAASHANGVTPNTSVMTESHTSNLDFDTGWTWPQPGKQRMPTRLDLRNRESYSNDPACLPTAQSEGTNYVPQPAAFPQDSHFPPFIGTSSSNFNPYLAPTTSQNTLNVPGGVHFGLLHPYGPPTGANPADQLDPNQAISQQELAAICPPNYTFTFNQPDPPLYPLAYIGGEPEIQSPYPSTPALSNGRRGSSVSVNATLGDRGSTRSPLTPSPLRSTKAPPKKSSTPTLFIPYDPNAGPKGSNKRPAPSDEGTLSRSGIPQQDKRLPIQGEDGKVVATRIIYGPTAKPRSRLTPEKKYETRIAREKGICSRCQKGKRKCDLHLAVSKYVSCTTCLSKTYKGRVREPCSQSKIEEIIFFRKGPAENEPLFPGRKFVLDLIDVSKPDVPVRTLRLTQNLGHELTVYVSEFAPEPSDVLSYKWINARGEEQVMEMPHYCLTNLDKVMAHMKQYIEVAGPSYLLNLLRQEDELVSMTVSKAMDFARTKPDSAVALALRLWATSRMIEITWDICGDDTLGTSRVTDRESPWFGKTPIPPNIDTQLDQIVIRGILVPLRTMLLTELEEKFNNAKPEAWFEIYLASFILLNHTSQLAKHSMRHAELHCMKSRFSNIKFLEEAFHSAKILLSRFHFICNGSAPFQLDWKSPSTASKAKLSSSEVEFMVKKQRIIRSRESEFLGLRERHRYDAPLHFSAQLFSANWDSGPVRVVEEVEDLGQA